MSSEFLKGMAEQSRQRQKQYTTPTAQEDLGGGGGAPQGSQGKKSSQFLQAAAEAQKGQSEPKKASSFLQGAAQQTRERQEEIQEKLPTATDMARDREDLVEDWDEIVKGLNGSYEILTAGETELAGLERAYRESPTPERALAYTQAITKYQQEAKKYDRYRSSYQAYTTPEAFQGRIDAWEAQLPELEAQEKAAKKALGTERAILSGTMRYGTMEQRAQAQARVDAAEKAYQDATAQNKALQEKIAQEKFNKEYLAYEALRGAENFEEESIYRPTANGKETKLDMEGKYLESGYDDLLYDIINGDPTAKSRGLNSYVRQYEEIDPDQVKLFNYIYKTRSPEEAYAYMDLIAQKQFNGIEAATLNFLRDSGISSMSAALGAGIAKLTGATADEGDGQDWYSELLKDTQQATEQHPMAGAVGRAGGTMALMTSVAKGLTLIPGFASLAPIAQASLSGAASMGGTAAIQGLGDVATGKTELGEYGANVLGSAAAGAAGGAAASGVGTAGTAFLKAHGLTENMLARTVVAGLAGAGGGAARSGVTQGTLYLRDPYGYEPDPGAIAEEALVGFAFSAIGYLTRNYTASPTEAAKMDADEAKAKELFGGLSEAEAKAKYRQMAKDLHPDLHPGDAAVEAEMKAVNGAWDWYTKNMMGQKATKGAAAYQKAQSAAKAGDMATYQEAKAEYDQSVAEIAALAADNPAATETDQQAVEILQAVSKAGISGETKAPPSPAAGPEIQEAPPEAAELPGLSLPSLPPQETDTTENAAPQKESGKKTLVQEMQEMIPQIRGVVAPVATVTGDELPKEGKMVDRVLGFIEKMGGKATRPGFGDVLFSRSRIKNGLVGHGAGRAKVETFAAVPDVIRDGLEIDTIENYEGRGYDTHNFMAPVTYRGKPTYLGVIVTKDKQDGRYYVHEVIDENGNIILGEKKAQQPPSDGRASLAGAFDTVAVPEPSTERIPQQEPEVKEPEGLSLPSLENDVAQAGPERMGTYEQGAAEAGTPVSDGDPGRVRGISAGEQTGGVAEGAGGKALPAEQGRTAVERQNRGRDLRWEKVSAASLGIEEGTEEPSVTVIPEKDWDDGLRTTAKRVQEETGITPSFVLGQIPVNTGSGITRVRGVYSPGSIIIQADHMRLTTDQIADHEIFHDKATQTPGLIRELEDRIVERYGPEEFGKIVETYIQKLRGVIDIPENASPDEIDEAYLAVMEEIMADAYAGINAFAAHAERYHGDVRGAVESREAGPRSEIAEATDRRTGPPERWSYGGKNANRADLESLARAREMEKAGADMEAIRRETGWFQGMDGLWRFEIDDSGMKYYKSGDAKFSRAHPEYTEYQKLMEKMFYSEMTDEEQNRLKQLDETWGREPGRLNERVARGNAVLEEILEHDALFENYPQLRNARVTFEALTGGALGEYRPEKNSIAISEKLRTAPEETLIHEIQHAIQKAEGFTPGASPEYWEREKGEEKTGEIKEKYKKAVMALNPEQRSEWAIYQELEDVLGELFLKEGREDDYKRYEAIQDGIHEKLQNEEWFRELCSLKQEIADASGIFRDMYKNTAGEIEARDTAKRRSMTAEQRRETPPDLGDEDTVFAEWEVDMGSEAEIEDPLELERTLNALRKERQDLEEKLDDPFSKISKEDERRARNRLVKVGHEIDKLVNQERNASVQTSLQTILENLGKYRRSDLESLAEQISDGAWDDYEELSRADLEEALREAIRSRMDDMSPLEAQVKKYGFYVRPPERAAEGIRESVPYNRTAVLNEDTIDKYLKDYAAKSSPGYAQAYIAYMRPSEFLDLTTSISGRHIIEAQSRPLDVEEFGEATRQVPLQLRIDHETGEVSGHEGRHRASALLAEGIGRIPVLLFDSSNKYDKAPIEAIDLHGQDFGSSKSDATVTVTDILPFSYENREAIVEKYSEAPKLEKAMERHGMKQTFRYSVDEPVDDDTDDTEREIARLEDRLKRIESRDYQEAIVTSGGINAMGDVEREIQETRDRLAELQGVEQTAEKKPKTKKPVAEPRPIIAKQDMRKNLMALFATPEGKRAEMGAYIDAFADRLLKQGSLTEEDKAAFFDRMYREGAMTIPAEEYAKAGRALVAGGRIHVNDQIREDLGDDWNEIRKRAFAAGIYLTSDMSDPGVDVWNMSLADSLPGMFDETDLDMGEVLKRIVQLAEEGKDEKVSLAEYTAQLAREEHVPEDELLEAMERQMEYHLRSFAEKANLEIKLRDRTGVKIAQQREVAARERQRETLRRAKEREKRREMAQRQREHKELRELQQKTLKQLQWLSKNRNRAPEDLKAAWEEVLGDIDLYAVGAANELRWSEKHQATWRDLADMYKAAKEEDPNFLPSKELERIVARLDMDKIGDMDVSALQDLYKAAVGLRTEFYNRNNVINDEMGRLFADVYESSKREIQEAEGGYTGKKLDQYMNMEQLSPINVLERMGGWDPDGEFFSMAKQLEKGERDVRAYKVQAERLLENFLNERRDWVKTADGQGEDAVWYELEVPELVELGMGDKPVFGDTIKVYMTPTQKVQLYLESKNYDNLRHMTGGRTFADKELYSQGKRQEALAQGRTIKLAPETVKKIVSDLTPEERELAGLLERYYNQFAKERINRVSNVLFGFDKAQGENYAPIFTNQNYTKSEVGQFDVTAEGVGHMKSRQYAVNPSYNIGALDAFERHVDQTSRFVGMAIPTRNWQTLLNWREAKNSMGDVITHKWGEEGKRYIEDLLTELQGGKIKERSGPEFMDTLLSNYISSVFGFNPSIVFKQAMSFPLAGAYLGWENIPNISAALKVDDNLINAYTSELAYRLMGYATPETAQLKNNPSRLSENKTLKFLFGGGSITAMDGWTVKAIWGWAENKVRRDRPELEMGSPEQIAAGESPFYQEVAKEFEEAVSRSQPMYDVMHRAQIMRRSGAGWRALTLFKTVPIQQYNMLRQTVAEAQRMKRERDAGRATEEEFRASRGRAGRAILGVILAALGIEAINFLNNMAKSKGKRYRDENGDFTFGSAGKQFLQGFTQDNAGMIAGGDLAAELLGSIITGDKWYGIDTPGATQVAEVLEQVVESSGQIRTLIQDGFDILKNGGDLGEYFRRNGADYLGEMGKALETVAAYFGGIPAANVKSYALGALRWISPAFATAYEDMLETAEKPGLAGLTGKALETRVGDILDNRLGKGGDASARVLAGLYEDGYAEAIPANTPKSVTIDGETRKLSPYQKQLYDGVWRDTVAGELDALTGSAAFAAAAPEVQARMVKKLYDLAAERAKAELYDDYEIKDYAETAAAVQRAGGSPADWAAWAGSVVGVKKSDQYGILRRTRLGDGVKKAILGSLLGTEMETESGEPSQYAKMETVLKDQSMDAYLELKAADAVEEYLKCTKKGMDPATARETALGMGEVREKAGKGASTLELYRAAVDAEGDQDGQMAALQAIMGESEYDRLEAGVAAGITPEQYVAAKEAVKTVDDNGSVTQKEAEKAIRSMEGLTTAERAALWQLQNKSWKAKANPFDKTVGERVYKALHAGDQEPGGLSLPSLSSSGKTDEKDLGELQGLSLPSLD